MAAPPTDSNAEGMTFGEQFFTLTGTYRNAFRLMDL